MTRYTHLYSTLQMNTTILYPFDLFDKLHVTDAQNGQILASCHTSLEEWTNISSRHLPPLEGVCHMLYFGQNLT